MSYYERDLRGLIFTCGVCVEAWSVPVSFSIGGSGLHERGFSVTVLCAWFALHWYPKSYPVHSLTQEDDSWWTAQFEKPKDRDQLCLEMEVEAQCLMASAERILNAAKVMQKATDGRAQKENE